MNTAKAQQLVITSAAVVAGVYAYRRYGGKTQTGLGTFVTAWGTIFFILSLGAEAVPGAAGAMALLVMVSDLLANTSGPNGLAAQVSAGLAGAGVGSSSSTPSGSGGSGGSGSGSGSVILGAAAASPQHAGATVPHGYHRVAGGVATVPHPSHSSVTPGGGQSVGSAAASEGLHYDPTSGEYVP